MGPSKHLKKGQSAETIAELERGKESHFCLQTSIPEHLNYLRVFLAILFENQLSLLIVVLVLASTTVLTTLFEGVSAFGLVEVFA